MAHFAEIENGIVKRVIVAEQDFINSGKVGNPSNWVQTSYTGSIRKNYAGIGYTYDKDRDAFIPPKPYPSWILNEANCQWEAPIVYPDDGKVAHKWDEANQKWL